MPEALKKAIEELGGAFAEFKKTNDQRLTDVEKKGGSDPLLDTKLAKIDTKLTELDQLKTDLEAQAKKNGRPGRTGGDNAAQEEHKAAFYDWFAKGDDSGLRELELKAMATDSDPDGGYRVPEEVDTEIERVLGTLGAMRRLATVRPVGSATYKKLVSVGGANSGWVGEREARGETATPTFKGLEFPTMELYAEPRSTQAMLDDGDFDVAGWLADEVSIEFSEQESNAFITGDGQLKPRGILGYGSIANASYAFGKVGHIASGAAGAFAATDPSDQLIDLVHSLKSGYRNNASWLLNDLTLADIRKLKDGNGDYLWRPGLEAGAPSVLLGKAVEIDDNMPDIAANSLSIAFGDFKRAYVITDRRGAQILRDPYTAKPYVKFYTTKRVGGGIQNFEAIKLMKFAAS